MGAAGTWAAALLLAAHPGALLAQPGETQPAAMPATPVAPAATPTLQVDSNPVGAVVTLRGEYEWVGQTPWRLYRPIRGVYRVEARYPGYETWQGEIVVGPGAAEQFTIDLVRKSAWRAATRSLVLPGWGQRYRGSPGKGTIMLSAVALGAVGLVWTHENYRDKVDDFERARDAYLAETRQSQLPELRARMEEASRDADRRYDRRRAVLYATAGVWALSVIDAAFFAPSGGVVIGGGSPAADLESSEDRPRAQLFAQATPGGAIRGGVGIQWK